MLIVFFCFFFFFFFVCWLVINPAPPIIFYRNSAVNMLDLSWRIITNTGDDIWLRFTAVLYIRIFEVQWLWARPIIDTLPSRSLGSGLYDTHDLYSLGNYMNYWKIYWCLANARLGINVYFMENRVHDVWTCDTIYYDVGQIWYTCIIVYTVKHLI